MSGVFSTAAPRGWLNALREDRELRRQATSFAVIGVICTIAYAALYSILRHWLSALSANGLALLATMGFNFTANRMHTFRGSQGRLHHQFGGYMVAYVIGLGASSLALLILRDALNQPRGVVDTAAAMASGLLATAVRFFLMRHWVFRDVKRSPASASLLESPD